MAGCFAALQGARSVCFADRSAAAVRLALRSAAENVSETASARACHVHGVHGDWSETASWPEVDLIIGNEILYVADAAEALTRLLQSRVLRPGGVATFCGCDRGLWDSFEQHLTTAGFDVRCGNGFAAAADGSAMQPTVLLLATKPMANGEVQEAPRSSLDSILIRPEAWQDTGASRAKLAPPPCVASPAPPAQPPPTAPAAFIHA